MSLNETQLQRLADLVHVKGLSASEAARAVLGAGSTNERKVRRFIARQSHEDFWDEYEPQQVRDMDSTGNAPVIKSYDIEFAPAQGVFFDIFKPVFNIDNIMTEPYMLSYAIKTLDVDDEYVLGCDDFGSGVMDDGEEGLVNALYEEFNNADILIAHNGKRFDDKKACMQFRKYGLAPPLPYHVIDTLHIVKANFAAISNKLDWWLTHCGHDNKLQHEGIKLWIKCMAGCPEAWAIMKAYNLQDTSQLELVYKEVRAWDSKHPNLNNFFNDGILRCGTCASENITVVEDVKPNEFGGLHQSKTPLSSFDTYRCHDCGAIKRSRSNNKTKEAMKVTLASVSMK